ncbi:DUF4347 domain-containing protein [Labrys neptuniae]
MLNSNIASTDPIQIVFIDSRVPDIQALIDGAAPGERVFVLDAASDGIQQIADILANNNLTGLGSISIVGHGTSGEIELGSSWINDGDLASHAKALSTIGAALAPGGDLALYACNTAAGAAGQQFISDLSHYAGGVDVAAATHLVGSADHGGSWTLDASTGPIEAAAPFTSAAIADFQGELAGALTSQIWFGADRDTLTGNQNPFGYVNSDGSGRTQVGTSPSDGSPQTAFSDIALDTAAGLYFALNQGEALTQNVHLVVGHTSGGAPISSTLSLNPNDYIVQGITVDPKNHVLYIGVWGDGQADSGIIKLSYSPTTGVVNNGQPIVSGSVIDPSYFLPKAGAAFTNPKDLYLDVAAQKIYFAANDFNTDGTGPYGNGFADTNGIYVKDLATNTTTLLSSASQFPATVAGAGLAISALTVNTTTGMIYFATEDQGNDQGAAHSTLWEMPIGGGTAVQMTLPSPLAFISPGGLAYDADSNQLVVSDGGDTLHTPKIAPAIHVLSLNPAGTSITGDTVLAHGDESAGANAITRAIALDELAHIGAFSGTTAMAVQGASSLLLLGATPTGVTDSDGGGFLASASVKISNAQAGDLIGIDTNFSFNASPQTVNFAGGTFSVSFDASTHILTIANTSGFLNTDAQYEALLAHVSFKDTGTDTSTGAHPTRTVVWQVNDGAVGNPVGPNNVTTTTVTIDRAPELTADTKVAVAGGSAASGNVLLNDSDRDGDTLSVTSFTDGTPGTVGTLFHGTFGDLTLNADGSYTYSAGATAGQQTALDNAAAGSHPTEVVSYTVLDGHGGSSSSTLTINVDRTPTAVADTNAVLAGGIAVSGNVLTNDTDRDGDALSVTGFTDGTTGTVGTLFHGTYGDLTLNATGAYSYAAGVTAGQQAALDSAPAGSHPTEVVTYTVSDGNGGTSTATLTVTIDRAPVTTADTDTAISGGAAAAGNVLTNDVDRDGDTLTVTGFTDGTAGTVGKLFHGTYGDITLNSDGSYTYTAGATAGQQSALTGAGGHASEVISYIASDGQGGTATSTLTIDVTGAPAITAIATSGAGIDAGGNGDLNAGHVVTLTVTMSAAVTVDTGGGSPTLALNDGGTATFVGGSGSDTLTFTYTVAAGENTADLAVNTVALNGATIKDAASRDADFTGTIPAPAGTLQIDTTTPTVSSVTTSGTDITAGSGDLNAGHVVTFTVNTSEAVLVDTTGGTPTLTLSNGETATYTGGSGSTALTFSYTVTAGHDTADLAVSAVNLNGGTVKDGAANNADLGAAVTNPTGILQIDTTTPTVASVTTSGTGIAAGNGDLNAGHVVTFTVNTSEAVVVDTSGGTPTLTLSNGETATYSGGSGSTALTFSYTVTAGHDTADLAVSAINLNGGSAKDGAGNNADLSAAVTNPTGTLQIDTTAPTVASVTTSGTGIAAGNGDLNAGHVVTFTVNTSEAVLVDTTNGTPTLTLSNGETATYSGGSGSTALTFSYTVTAGHDTADLAVSAINLNGGSAKDGAGNNADLSAAVTNPTGTLQIDTTAPAVSSVTTSGTGIDAGGNGDLNAGHVVTFTVNTSEAVVVDTTNGTPFLTLSNGETAAYTGGSGSSALTFSYTVTPGHDTADLAVSAVNLNGGSAKDGAGNNADLSAAVTNPTGTLQIDTTAPAVSSVTTSGTGIDAGGNGDLNAGHVVTFTVNTSEAVLVDTTNGTPFLTLSNGETAAYTGGSGSTVLTFSYTVTPGHDTADLAVSAVNLNGGSAKDGAGNNADLSAAVTNPTGTLQIDTTAPAVSSVTTSGTGIDAGGNGDLNAGHVVTFTVNTSEAVVVDTNGGTPFLTLSNGETAAYTSGSGSSVLTFSYTVTPGHDTADLAVSAVNLNGGTVKDAAANNADLSGAVTNPTGTLQIDTTAPTVSVSSDHTVLTAGGSAAVTFTFSEAVSDFTLGDVTVSQGTLSNLSHVGVNGLGQDVYTSTFTPDATNTENGTVQVSPGSYHDLANNNGAASNVVTFTGDTLAPHLSSATANPPTGAETYGQTVKFTLTFTEAVQFAGGTPTLTLNDGGTATYDSVATAALHDPTKLVFDYTVGAADSTSQLAITGVANGSITDHAGNAATGVSATFPGLSVEGSLITANPDSNSVTAGQTLTVNAAHGVLSNDTDTNPNDHLVVGTVNGSAAGVDHAIAGSYGSLTLHADGSYSYTANASSNGYVVDSFTYTASNGHSPTSQTTLHISVVGGNYAYVQVPAGGTATTGYGNTVLDGSAGHATLTAASTFNAHEILIGGDGDILNAGNYGQDIFVFANNFGHNTINNFHNKLDTIQLQQSQFGSIANVMADLKQVNADTVLTLDNDHVVTITNTQLASLTAANFHLV